MNENDKKELMKEFKNADGSKRLEMWDYAISQQVIWEQISAEMQNIAREQGVDKELDKLVEEEMKKAEEESG
jgi:hypothetical protein